MVGTWAFALSLQGSIDKLLYLITVETAVYVEWPLSGRWVGFCPPKRAKASNIYHFSEEDFLPPTFFTSITLPSKSNQKDDPIEMAIPLINQPITR